MKSISLITTVLVITLIVLLVSVNLSGQNEKLTILPTDKLKDILDKTITNEGLPGIVAAIIDSNGIVLVSSAGVRKSKNPTPITDQDKLHLGSCTKAMTSAMLAVLVDEGILSWETTISDIFADVKDSIHIDYHAITLFQLVRHRGRINDNAFNWWSYSDKEIKSRRLAILTDNLKKQPKVKAGEFLYSNLGYMIAGAMAEQVTGKSWEDLMHQKIFKPLGMTSAGFGSPGEKDKIDQPWGHSTTWFSGLTPSQGDNAEALGPAGTVHCSIEDWAKFIAFQFLKKDQNILSPTQLENLKTVTGEYAAGWNKLERTWAKGNAYTHAGSNTMWLSLAWVAPEINKAYLVVANSYDQNVPKVCDNVIGHLLKLDEAIK